MVVFKNKNKFIHKEYMSNNTFACKIWNCTYNLGDYMMGQCGRYKELVVIPQESLNKRKKIFKKLALFGLNNRKCEFRVKRDCEYTAYMYYWRLNNDITYQGEVRKDGSRKTVIPKNYFNTHRFGKKLFYKYIS